MYLVVYGMMIMSIWRYISSEANDMLSALQHHLCQLVLRLIAWKQSLGVIREECSLVTRFRALNHLRAWQECLNVVFLGRISGKARSIRKTVSLWGKWVTSTRREHARGGDVWIWFEIVYHVDNGWASASLAIL